MSMIVVKKTQLTIWHDLECNYLIRRIDATFSGSKINNSVTVSEFVEPNPGVFLPTKCRRVQYTGADVSQIRITTLTNYTVNQPIPGSEFALPAIASGTILDDAINGTTSAIDSDWRPIGKSKAYEGTTLLPPQSPPEGIEKGQSSTDEPTSWVSVFILAATGLLIGSLVWLVRSRRKISQR